MLMSAPGLSLFVQPVVEPRILEPEHSAAYDSSIQPGDAPFVLSAYAPSAAGSILQRNQAVTAIQISECNHATIG
jgi:hypothetical protein